MALDLTATSSSRPTLGDRIIKVNHAGEHGAFCIYSGQFFAAWFTARKMRSELSEFRSHEARHRSIFEAELRRRGRTRCRSYWLCGFGGYLLGVVTGLLAPSAIAATTVAVERVVLHHLQRQLVVLRDDDPAAICAISAIIDDEQVHLDRSATIDQTGRFWRRILTPIVSASAEAVIWQGMKL